MPPCDVIVGVFIGPNETKLKPPAETVAANVRNRAKFDVENNATLCAPAVRDAD